MASAHLEDSISTEFESLRERLLQNGPFIDTTTTTTTTSTAPEVPKQHTSHDDTGTSPTVLNAYQQQPQHGIANDATLAQPPRLKTARSAPESRMAAMVDETPQPVRAMPSSFHVYPGGDTQLMESQVYRDYRPGVAEPVQLQTPARPIVAIESTTAQSLVGESQTELMLQNAEGEANSYIDLAKAWPEQPSQTARSTTSEEVEDFLVSPQTQFDHQTSDRLFVMPQTPYPVTHNQLPSEDMPTVDRSSKTPALERAFGPSRTPMISATQLFNQTQAVSSPLPDTIASDPILTRPSPNLHNENALPTSNIGFSSSPVLTKARPASTAGEPRDYYTSMRESQERRRRGIAVDNLPTIDEAGNGSLSSLLKRQERQRLRRTLSEQATVVKHTAGARSPLDSDEHVRKRRRITDEGEDHFHEMQHDPHDLVAAEDVERRSDDEDEARSIEGRDDEAHRDATPIDQDDAYDEFAQAIMRSQPHDNEDNDGEDDGEGQEEIEAEPDDNDDSAHIRMRTYKHIAPDNESYMVSISSQPHGYEPGKVFHSTQLSAVVDSQTGPQAGGKRSLMSAYHEQRSSLTNVVPGSQYAAPLSQSRSQHAPITLNSTTSQQSPLQTSPAFVAGQKVLSSPPMVAGDQEIEVAAREATTNGTSGHAFTTARSHISADAPDATARSADLPDTQDSMITPLKLAGALRFNDIAGSLSQRELPREDSIDLDAIMDTVITEEDQHYLKALQSPSTHGRKRRKVARTIVSSEPPSSANALHHQDQGAVHNADEVQSAQMDAAASVPVVSGPGSDASTRTRRQTLRKGDTAISEVTSTSNTTSLPNAQIQQHEPWSESNHNLETLPSLRDRRAAASGAVSVSTDVDTTATASSRTPAATKQRQSRKRKRSGLTAEDPPERPTSHDREGASLARLTAVDVAVPGKVVERVDGVQVLPTAEDELPITAPHRVFALFGGGFNAYYPATILSASDDKQTVSVRFDDTSLLDIKASEVFRLDLRVGDIVKVDLPVMRKTTWMIKGFVPGANSLETDARGNDAIEVQAKTATRRSSAAVPEAESETHKVALSTIYLTHNLASSYRARTDTAQMLRPLLPNRLSTPALASAHAADADTPTSRSGRQLKATGRAPIAPSPAVSDKSATAFKLTSERGVFASMGFAISLSTDEAQKKDIVRKIESSGGVILEKGFDELFVNSSSDAKHKSTGKGELELLPAHKHLKFVALIASSCSRRAKYVQALALGLPTLSSRWIHDTLDPARNASLATGSPTTLRWSRYLLPAGESLYLHGAIRSRMLSPYSPEEATLQHTVDTRSLLLNGDKVLLVAPSKGRASQNQERVNLYTFLTTAMGAGKVKRVFSLAEADSIVKHDDSWKWVHVDGDVDSAAKFLFADSEKQRPVKKEKGKGKKSSVAAEEDRCARLSAKRGGGTAAGVTIVSDEYVIQSLILGALLD